MKRILIVIMGLMLQSHCLLAIADNSNGEGRVITVGSFKVTMPSDWQYKEVSSDSGVSTNIFPIDNHGTHGSLSLMSLTVPTLVTRERLRLLTNVDSSISLDWGTWGELSGFQYDYVEEGQFFKQWWLVGKNAVLFLVYRRESKDDGEIRVINQIVSTLSVI